jgi:glycosyltransferase involved in cell wall biosynthesis
MRILNLIPSLSGGGAERQLSYLAPELVKMGHDVHIAYLNDGPEKLTLEGVVLHQLKSSSNYNPFLILQLLRKIKKIKPDIIHTWILQMDVLGGIAAKISGIPWIIREPSSSMAYPSTWKNKLRLLTGRDSAAIVANSEGGKDYWRKKFPNKKFYIIPNGLPLDTIEKIPAAFPESLRLPDIPVLLYVGRLSSGISASKNLRIFLNVVEHVRKKQKVAGILCGEGPQQRELEELRHKLGLDEDVYFTGRLPAAIVWSMMKKATIFVSLSAYEGCPNTVMEAMACECPIIVSDIPAHREILDEGSAIFVNPNNIEEIGNIILDLLKNAGTLKLRSSKAKQMIQTLSVTEMAKKYQKIYQEVI